MGKTDKKMLWGSATAAYQCEGAWNEDGKGPSIWDEFSHSGRNTKGITGDVSCDFYHHYAEDIRMMAEGGQNTFRFSISWSRLFPENNENLNQKGVDFYNRVLDKCEKYHIIPNVTLLHYDLPAWAGSRAWENEEFPEIFADYCDKVFRIFGNRIPYYVTINEPNHNSFCGYMTGNYPPHDVVNMQTLAEVCYRKMVANAKAIERFRKEGLKYSKIGIVNGGGHVGILKDTPEYRLAQHYAELFGGDWVLYPAIKGYFHPDTTGMLEKMNINLSFVKSEDLNVLRHNTVDFIGDNVYNRSVVKPYESGETGKTVNNDPKHCRNIEGTTVKGLFQPDIDPNTKRNLWGREIYPPVGYDALIRFRDEFGNIPVFVTECGHGEMENLPEDGIINDKDRVQFLSDYLDYIIQAKNKGCNLLGFYVWSSMDLYSWINGYEKRYGLVYVDYNHACRRIPKKSYYWYMDYITRYRSEKTEGK